MAVSEEVQQKVAGVVRDLLAERFKDDFVFDPIIVQSHFDEYDDEYLHVYIVFDGDQKKLDPSWTVGLSGRIWPASTESGYPNLPSKSFIAKRAWDGRFGRKYRETGRVR